MIRPSLDLLKDTFQEWKEDDALQWGAALSYYAVFSMAPILIISIGVAGLILGPQGIEGQVLEQVEAFVGPDAARLIDQMVRETDEDSGLVAALVGLVALLVGATTFFAQLQVALNRMWDVRSTRKGIKGFLRKRLFAFLIVLGVGALLLAFLIASAALSALDERLPIPPALKFFYQAGSLVVSFGVITLLFGLVFRMLPDVLIRWRDVWTGAAATAALFSIGQLLIAIYLGNSSLASGYGAAGSLVLLLVWVYYSSQTFLFGAELTQVTARRRGARIVPDEGAEWIP